MSSLRGGAGGAGARKKKQEEDMTAAHPLVKHTIRTASRQSTPPSPTHACPQPT